MSKHLLILVLSLFGILVLVLTNPREEEHKSAVRVKINAFMQHKLKETTSSSGDSFSQLGQGIGSLFGGYVVDKIIDTAITRDNYLIFSITKFSYEGNDKVIGLGILGNVFLSSKVDEALEDTQKDS